MTQGWEPVADDELLFRRIPLSQENCFSPAESDKPSKFAFRPRHYDSDGLSLTRAKYSIPEQEAGRAKKKGCFIAVLRAGDLRQHGIAIEAKPLPDNIGHVVLPGIRYDNRREPEVEAMQVLLAQKLCVEVLGPFK